MHLKLLIRSFSFDMNKNALSRSCIALFTTKKVHPITIGSPLQFSFFYFQDIYISPIDRSIFEDMTNRKMQYSCIHCNMPFLLSIQHRAPSFPLKTTFHRLVPSTEYHYQLGMAIWRNSTKVESRNNYYSF